ncbi:MAG: sigma 54-interacting transcriptional regulator, partial [Myxococcota bacterium]|nr:sigma 54-interacting transcriptional regulator [Myxococcota bacterium]
REVRPVGGSRLRKVDVRVVAASNRDLRAEAANGVFREDLYYRLAVLPIEVPPLRQRTRDILPLAEHFLALHGKREHKPDCQLSPSAHSLLLAHDWPGNVRELENEMLRALALADAGDWIGAADLSEHIARPSTLELHAMSVGESLHARLARIEAQLIREALAQNQNNRTATARKLGVTREGLHKKMKRLGVL